MTGVQTCALPISQAGTAAAPTRPAVAGESPVTGGNEIWRMEAEGDVRISTATDTARGDRAVYDIDQAVLVLTGRAISYATPRQIIVARDSLEYWTQRRMAVGRGAATVITDDGRRIAADTLVAYMLEDPPANAAPAATRPPASPTPTPPTLTPSGARAPVASAPVRPGTLGTAAAAPGQGRVDRVELFGNVEIRTETETVRGDRGVYSAVTGMARVLGNVRITRGDNHVAGREALVNLNTGVSRILSQPGQRVQGIITPSQGTGEAARPPTRGTPR